MKILVVDDDRSARRSLSRILARLGDVELREAASLEEARRELAEGSIDVVLIDVRLDPDARNRDGLTLVGEVRKQSRAVPIVVTGSHEMAEVRAAMRLGAYDYIFKDEVSEEMVLPILQGLRSTRALETEVLRLRARQRTDSNTCLVGTSSAMRQLRSLIARVSVSDRPVLVTGPTGSGKELVVRELHAHGRDPTQPLLDLNCAAFPAELIESQLFGHERGSFTGAVRKHDGFFAAVGEGTLFLDEIAELPLELQAKLLRVLESGTYRPVGSQHALRFVGRIVAATHADLRDRVQERRFREDLYYRLNVLELNVPALAERRDDIPALVAHFAASQAAPMQFSSDAIEAIRTAEWPGNVRELRNFIDRLAVFTDGEVTAEVVVPMLRGDRDRDRLASPLSELARAVLRLPGTDKLMLIERVLVDEALRLADGNKTAAARLLGVHRKVVARRSESPDSDQNIDFDPT